MCRCCNGSRLSFQILRSHDNSRSEISIPADYGDFIEVQRSRVSHSSVHTTGCLAPLSLARFGSSAALFNITPPYSSVRANQASNQVCQSCHPTLPLESRLDSSLGAPRELTDKSPSLTTVALDHNSNFTDEKSACALPLILTAQAVGPDQGPKKRTTWTRPKAWQPGAHTSMTTTTTQIQFS